MARDRAKPATIRKYLREWDAIVLECRDFGHAWSQESWSIPTNGRAVLVRVLRCGRCEMDRTDTLVRRTGEVFARSYTPPEGYYARGAGVHVIKQDVRREAIERLVARREGRA